MVIMPIAIIDDHGLQGENRVNVWGRGTSGAFTLSQTCRNYVQCGDTIEGHTAAAPTVSGLSELKFHVTNNQCQYDLFHESKFFLFLLCIL
jgi:hypothetical protein